MPIPRFRDHGRTFLDPPRAHDSRSSEGLNSRLWVWITHSFTYTVAHSSLTEVLHSKPTDAIPNPTTARCVRIVRRFTSSQLADLASSCNALNVDRASLHSFRATRAIVWVLFLFGRDGLARLALPSNKQTATQSFHASVLCELCVSSQVLHPTPRLSQQESSSYHI
jgi:hypothetical protein